MSLFKRLTLSKPKSIKVKDVQKLRQILCLVYFLDQKKKFGYTQSEGRANRFK